MDNEQDATSTGVSRGQNQLHVLPEDAGGALDVVEPFLERIDPAAVATGPQLLVVTHDAEGAASIAARLTLSAKAALRVLGATDARRAARVQRGAPAHVVLGPPLVLLELLKATVLKLDSVRTVALAWIEESDAVAMDALEVVMAEVPKDAARLVLVGDVSPSVDQLVERYARRARRVLPAGETQAPVSLAYVTVTESARLPMLRRLLDAIDPQSATILARGSESRAAVAGMLRSLGYADDSAIRVSAEPEPGAELVILYDLPSSEDEVRRSVRSVGSARVIALVAPRQLTALRRLAGGGVTPFTLPSAAERARSREDRLRDELRATLARGGYSRELLSLEPLLAEYDGAEIAAAALRMLEEERTKPRAPASVPAPSAMTRLYVNVGEMDNVRPGDLVGAIANEAGISPDELGRVDVRERHSTVEVATAAANTVIEKLTGVSIRGRRVIAKVDEAPARGGPDRAGRDRPGRERRDRPARPRPRRQ